MNGRVFVCSTSEDLEAERRSVLDALDRLQMARNSMESFGARNEQPLETCLAEVRASDVMVIIVGRRYGSVARANLSFCEAEYQEAQRLGKPCLVYMQREDALREGQPQSAPDELERLQEWKAALRREHTVAWFRNASDLGVQVAADVPRAMHAPARRQRRVVRHLSGRGIRILILAGLLVMLPAGLWLWRSRDPVVRRPAQGQAPVPPAELRTVDSLIAANRYDRADDELNRLGRTYRPSLEVFYRAIKVLVMEVRWALTLPGGETRTRIMNDAIYWKDYLGLLCSSTEGYLMFAAQSDAHYAKVKLINNLSRAALREVPCEHSPQAAFDQREFDQRAMRFGRFVEHIKAVSLD
jgi:hypothetical protein